MNDCTRIDSENVFEMRWLPNLNANSKHNTLYIGNFECSSYTKMKIGIATFWIQTFRFQTMIDGQLFHTFTMVNILLCMFQRYRACPLYRTAGSDCIIFRAWRAHSYRHCIRHTGATRVHDPDRRRLRDNNPPKTAIRGT